MKRLEQLAQEIRKRILYHKIQLGKVKEEQEIRDNESQITAYSIVLDLIREQEENE